MKSEEIDSIKLFIICIGLFGGTVVFGFLIAVLCSHIAKWIV